MTLLQETWQDFRGNMRGRWIAPLGTLIVYGVAIAILALRTVDAGADFQFDGLYWMQTIASWIVGATLYVHLFLYWSGPQDRAFLSRSAIAQTVRRLPAALFAALALVIRLVPYIALAGIIMVLPLLLVPLAQHSTALAWVSIVAFPIAYLVPVLVGVAKFGNTIAFVARGDFGPWSATRASKTLYKAHRKVVFVVLSPLFAVVALSSVTGLLATLAPEFVSNLASPVYVVTSSIVGLPLSFLSVGMTASLIRVYLAPVDEEPLADQEPHIIVAVEQNADERSDHARDSKASHNDRV